MVFEAARINAISATFDSNSNKVVFAYVDDGNSDRSTAVVGTVDSSDNSISFGTPVQITTNNTESDDNISCTFDSNSNKVVIAYKDTGNSQYGTAVVGTVSGTGISFGTPVVFESDEVYTPAITFDSNSNKVVIAFADKGSSQFYGKAIVGTVSGTGISFGSLATFESANTGNIACTFDSTANKVCIVYDDNGNSSAGTSVVATVSGTSISFGTAVVFNTGETTGMGNAVVFDSTNGRVVIFYSDGANSQYLTGISGTISGTSISFSSEIVVANVATNSTSAGFDSTSGRAVFAYRDSSQGKAVVFSPVTTTTLTAENYIGMSGGAVSYTGDVVPQVIGSAVVYEQAYSSDNRSVFDSNSNRIVIAYTDQGNSSYGTAVVGTVSGTSISFGTPVVFESANSAFFGPAFDSSNNKVVIAYKDSGNSNKGTAIVGTVNPSDNSISFGTAALFESSGTVTFVGSVFDSNANKIVVHYRDHSNSFYGTAAVGTVSGTNISFGTPVVFETAQTDSQASVFDSNSNKVVISYKDSGNSGHGTSIVGTVSGTTISFGSAVVFASASTDMISATFDSNLNKVVIAYRDDGNSKKGTAIVGTVSGTSISFGSEVVFSESNIDELATSATFDSNINKVVIAYSDGSNSRHGTFRSGTVSGTSISFDATAVFNADRSEAPSATFDSSNNKVVIAFRAGFSPNYGTAVVSQIGVDTRVTNRGQVASGSSASVDIIGTVSENQNELTAGQSYFVQTDGTIALTAGSPSVFAGTAISATKLLVKT